MINEVFSAIYNRLDTQLATPIFDHVPEGEQGFPFIRVDPLELRNGDVDDKSGFVGSIQIISYSRYKGTKEVSDIALAVYGALHRWVAPDTTSYSFSTIHQTFSSMILSDDGLTRHSIQRFEVVFEPL